VAAVDQRPVGGRERRLADELAAVEAALVDLELQPVGEIAGGRGDAAGRGLRVRLAKPIGFLAGQ